MLCGVVGRKAWALSNGERIELYEYKRQQPQQLPARWTMGGFRCGTHALRGLIRGWNASFIRAGRGREAWSFQAADVAAGFLALPALRALVLPGFAPLAAAVDLAAGMRPTQRPRAQACIG